MTTFSRQAAPVSPMWSRRAVPESPRNLEALVLPASGPSRRHATRVLERAGFRLERMTSLDDGLNLSKDDPTVCALVPVQRDAETQQAADGWLDGRTLAELERKAFLDTLDATNGNRAETARRLGVSEKTVYNKLRAWGMLSTR